MKVRFDFRHRLTVFAVGLVALSMGVISFVSYWFTLQRLEAHLGTELLAVVKSVAPLVDGDLLRFIAKTPDELIGKEEFEQIQATLLKVKKSQGLESEGSPIYVMRLSPDFEQSRELEFVVMTDRDRHGNYFVGNRTRSEPHHLRVLKGVAARTRVYEDAEGAWISAAAPILNSDGAIVGLLQADRPVNYFYVEARQEALWIGLGALGCLMLSALVAAGIARSLARPVEKLLDATQKIAGGELGHRVDLGRNDELGDLGVSVNNMASVLEKQRFEAEEHERELVEANRSKSEFLANMSHELRTPLNAILGYSEMIAEDATDNGHQEYLSDLKRINTAGSHLLTLINDILDLSKIEAGKMTIQPEWINVENLVDECIAIVEPLAAKNNNDLVVHPWEPLGDYWVDQTRFRQSLFNLLSNACKFTHNGRVELSMELEVAEGEEWCHWCVRDNGKGISEEDQRKLFTAFTQVNASSTKSEGGTGLGLAITKRLCDAMGGKIDLQSEPGVGSAFTFTLPRLRFIKFEDSHL